jgi:hypothetical protein
MRAFIRDSVQVGFPLILTIPPRIRGETSGSAGPLARQAGSARSALSTHRAGPAHGARPGHSAGQPALDCSVRVSQKVVSAVSIESSAIARAVDSSVVTVCLMR